MIKQSFNIDPKARTTHLLYVSLLKNNQLSHLLLIQLSQVKETTFLWNFLINNPSFILIKLP